MLMSYFRYFILIMLLFASMFSYAQNHTNLKLEIDSIVLNNIVVDYNDGIKVYVLNDSLLNKSIFHLPLNGLYGLLTIQEQNGDNLSFLVNDKAAVLKLSLNNKKVLEVIEAKNLVKPFDKTKNITFAAYLAAIENESSLLNELFSKHTYVSVNKSDSLKSIQNHLLKLINVKKMKVFGKYPNNYFSFLMIKNLIESTLVHDPDPHYLKELITFLTNSFPKKFINTPETEHLLKTIDYKVAALSNQNNIRDWIFIADNYNDFKLNDLTSEYILIDFWATWCPPCMQQLPEIDEMSKNYPISKLQIIGINVDRKYAAFKQATLNLSQNWIHVFDEKSHITRFFDVKSFPTTILLDKERNIIKYFNGYIDKAEILKLIK